MVALLASVAADGHANGSGVSRSERSSVLLLDVELPLSPTSSPSRPHTTSCPAADGSHPARSVDAIGGACAQLLTVRRTVALK